DHIDYPTGITETWNFSPSWASGWSQPRYSCLELSYSSGSTALAALTWGMVFDGTPVGTSTGRRYTNAALYRIYYPSQTVLKDQTGSGVGQPYTISSSSTAVGQIVYSNAYDASNRVLTRTQSVNTGTAFAATLTTDTSLPDRTVYIEMFDTSG